MLVCFSLAPACQRTRTLLGASSRRIQNKTKHTRAHRTLHRQHTEVDSLFMAKNTQMFRNASHTHHGVMSYAHSSAVEKSVLLLSRHNNHRVLHRSAQHGTRMAPSFTAGTAVDLFTRLATSFDRLRSPCTQCKAFFSRTPLSSQQLLTQTHTSPETPPMRRRPRVLDRHGYVHGAGCQPVVPPKMKPS